MKVLIDADACPVVKIAEKVAKKYNIAVVLFCDTNHVLSSQYSEVVTVSAGADAVDFALCSRCEKGDIVITQDYGVAAMVLSKGAKAIHQSGTVYTDSNIDLLLAMRYETKKLRRASSKNHLKGPKKRTPKDDVRFEENFEKLLNQGSLL